MKIEKGSKLLLDESAFEQWKRTLCVPKKTAGFSTLSEKYIRQREIRQNKEKYSFIEYLPYDIKREMAVKLKLKEPEREEKTLAIDVSEKAVRRACLFMDYLIEKLKELGASVDVDQFQVRSDNTTIHWERIKLFCELTEQTTSYRNRSKAPTGDMTPPYERIPTGEFTLTFYDEKKNGISFSDDGNNRIENQIQEIFTGFRNFILPLKKLKDEESEKENQRWQEEKKRYEQRRAAEAAEEARKKQQEYRKQIYGLMSAWDLRKRAIDYIEELNNNLSVLPEEQQKKVADYCEMVRQLFTVENQYQDVLDFMRKMT